MVCQYVDAWGSGRSRSSSRPVTRKNNATGCPVLVNTSFNVRGEPIVCTPEDAYRCFLATEMDALVLESFVILKRELKGQVADEKTRAAYLSQFRLD